MVKKRIRLLTTGGTIASAPGQRGLEPRRSDVMELALEQLRNFYDITVEDVLAFLRDNFTRQHMALSVIAPSEEA